ncbi:MAG: hypothetical protein V4566_06895 [Pseudomonadota bacterium]
MKSTTWRWGWPWVLLLAVVLGTAWLRYSLIESHAIGQQCDAVNAPAWCSGRQWLIVGFLYHAYGAAALLAAALSLLSQRPWLAWLAAALGAFAFELYDFEIGAVSLLIGSLRLLRLQARVAPVEQHRRRQQHVQSQP